ncbi:hypothetical protein N5C70_21905 [Pseudomonas juntendi]|uniref:Uncharacterized protein n=1 Tax=Pseudomonas juntendi TaxID=2666183 RepID=A0ABD4YJE7_9PSED|nr:MULTISPECIES: hypothetical protein [Pseudomonas]MDH0759344.1 hypothetical protein [Pseudomonas juntendi]MDH1922661.1 hypothetical protein [Pseudomonas juntendi]RRV72381.1 hypothetical protein EGJ15_09610 [Pseudomonas sp. p99-361]
MPTPDWRYEKSSSAVKALCRVLLTELDENQRADIQIALHDSLKLLCNAITAEYPKRGDLWTPGLVKLFSDQPRECERWLELLDEPDFKPDYYGRS